MGFSSILFEGPEGAGGLEQAQEPEFFQDLNLDQVLASLIAGREEYDLAPFFFVPLQDVAAVRYRQEVFHDLARDDLRQSIMAFAQGMRDMRRHLLQAQKLHYRYQQERWFLDAVDLYCRAVLELNDELARSGPRSRGLRAFREFLTGLTTSESFTALVADTKAVRQALDGVRYAVHINGARVKVSRYAGEADYSAQVEQTFAKFKQGAVKDYRVDFLETAQMNHVEARILDLVARLYPDVFGALDAYYAHHQAYLDATIARFDREIEFYIAYLDYIHRFKRAGLPFCYPEVSAQAKDEDVRDAFDIALANKLVPEGQTVVCNSFSLTSPERLIVVTGPNQGGKTTFARLFGQLHYLASLGLPVPGSSARLYLPDRVFTHFEKEEDITTLRGKLDDELVRMREILQVATSDSVLVVNEIFAATTLRDALFLSTAVIRQILELGALGVCVTFLDELASLSDATVSMVSTVVPENPAQRTYKIVRKPADGLAYAWAIAEKYGLTYQRLKERVAS
jgi:DNA mismatch repair ATPase MutS